MKIVAIVITYNPDKDLLKRQNDSLKTQVDDIIYVDNSSSNRDVIDSVLSANAFVVYNYENAGLAKAQNQGIELAGKSGADFVILFDQDSVPPSNFVNGLLSCYEKQSLTEKVALVGPVIKNRTTDNYSYKGVVFNGFSIKRVEVGSATEVSYCIASGSLIPLKVLNDVGGLKDFLFIDGLDVEWCLRAKKKGYKIFQTNNTFLDHQIGDGSLERIKSHSIRREYYIIRNSIWMAKQGYVPCGYRMRKIFSTLGRLLLSIKNFDLEYFKAELKGLYDGIRLCS